MEKKVDIFLILCLRAIQVLKAISYNQNFGKGGELKNSDKRSYCDINRNLFNPI